MAFRFFTVPVQDSAAAEAEVNAFLGVHKVLAVDRRWVDLGPSSFWALCVDYLPGGSVSPRLDSRGRSRVDYKEVLTPEEFAVFAKLRDVRKRISQVEAVPVYTIFTNEQLAQIVQRRARTKAALAKIEGIGDARLDKYADLMLPILKELPEGTDAADRPVV